MATPIKNFYYINPDGTIATGPLKAHPEAKVVYEYL